MRAHELTYGDWILYRDTPTKVKQITRKKIGWHYKDHECNMHYAALRDVLPMELTDDFFNKNQHSDIVNVTHYDNAEYSYIAEVCNKFINVKVNIKYVHEFQRLLRTAGLFWEAENIVV